MIGSVVEKESKSYLAPIKINPIGFPEALRKNESNVNIVNRQSKAKIIMSNDLNDKVLRNNDYLIDASINISDEELKSALDEIKSLISPKNIDYLKNKYNDKKNSKLSSNSQPFEENVSDIFSNSLNEISKMSDDFHNIRFDLNGCKIVRKDFVYHKMSEELSKSSVIKFTDGVNHNDQIVQLCIDCMMPIASNIQQNEKCDTYFVMIDSSNDYEDHSRTELLHHQFDPQESGYNFREISEMFRSEFGNQRQLAIRMLSGILLRREWLVSLEAYYELGHTRFGQSVYNEIGQRSNLFYMLCECFKNILLALMQKFHFSVENEILCISLHNVEVSSQSLGNATDISDGVHREYMNIDIVSPLKKIIVSLLIHLLCTSDFPVELPTLLLWAVSSSNTSGISSMGTNSKLSLIRCIRFYLFSPIEEFCASTIRDSSILWGSYYIPGLSTPHNRRVDLTYEIFSRECSEKVKNMHDLKETDSLNQNAIANINELFALKCRWHRVDVFANNDYMDSNLITQISLYIVNAINNIINNKMEHNCQSSTMEMNYFLGIQALEILTCFLRQGSASTVNLIRDAFLDMFITQFIILIDFTNSDLSNLKFQLIRLTGWKFLIELVIRDRKSSENLFRIPNSTTDWLHSMMVRRFSTVWSYDIINATSFEIEESQLILRLLKVVLVYGTGLQCCSEMLLAVMIKSASINSSPVNELIQDNYINAEIFNLLEQAIVTASSVLTHHSLVQINCDEKLLTDAIEFARSVLSFTKQYWVTIERYISRQYTIVAQCSDTVPLSEIQISIISSIFSFLCSLFICRCPMNMQSFYESDSFDLDRSYCNTVFAKRINNNIFIRGYGLIDSIHLFVQSQSVVNRHTHTIIASIAHLDGQCMELLDLSCEQQLLNIQFVLRFSDLFLGKISYSMKKLEGITAEFILSLQRYISMTYLTYLYNVSFNSKFSAILLQTHTYEQFDVTIKQMQLCSDLIVTVEKILKLGSVSNGLFQWHLQRLYHASILLNLLFRSSIMLISQSNRNLIHNSVHTSHHSVLKQNNMNDFNVLVSKCLFTFNSYIFSGVQKYIFMSYLKCLVCTSVRKEFHKQMITSNSSTDTVVVIVLNENTYSEMEDRYSNTFMDLYNSLYNRKSSMKELCIFPIDTVLNNYNVLTGIKYCNSINSSDEWLMHKPEDNIACPSMKSWPYNALKRLSGETLGIWLQVLNINFVNLLESFVKTSMYDIAFAMHSLIQLTNSDHIKTWLINDTVNEEKENIELNVNLLAVESYNLLLQKLSFYILFLENELRIKNSFASEFSLVAQNEFTSSNIVAKVIGEMKSHNANNMRNKSQGVLDLCDKSIDAAINQAINPHVHAVTMITLIAPNMPWMIRLRVWKQIGDIKLLHLMNNEEYLVSVLPLHVLRPEYIFSGGKNQLMHQPVCESFSLYVAMIDALSQLRVESDRTMGIVVIALFQISHFIFRYVRFVTSITTEKDQGFIQIEALSKQLLNDLILKVCKDNNLLWIIHSIIIIGTNFDKLNLQWLFDSYNNLEALDSYARDKDKNLHTLNKLKYCTTLNSVSDTTSHVMFNMIFNQDDVSPISIHLNRILIDYNEQKSYNLFELLNTKDFSNL